MIISDNATCFNARILEDFMEDHSTEWRTVLAYASMSNGKAEQMVGTMEKEYDVLLMITDWIGIRCLTTV